jgi:hypothetical protein
MTLNLRWLSRSAAAAATVLTIVATTATAAWAETRRHDWHGVKAEVGYHIDINDTKTAQGRITGTPLDSGVCAEVWFDWRSHGGHSDHHDAHAVQSCVRHTGSGRVEKTNSILVTGIRTTVCTYNIRTFVRQCQNDWPIASVRGGTYKLQTI